MISKNDVDRKVRLFWSGGWDSTFRLLELSQEEGLAIRPMYIRDHARKGMVNELSAMRDILPLVREMSKAQVMDVELYDRGSILRDFPDEDISAVYVCPVALCLLSHMSSIAMNTLCLTCGDCIKLLVQ